MVCLAELLHMAQAAESLREAIQQAESSATRATTIPDGMPHPRNIRKSKVENGAVIIADLKAKYAVLTEQRAQLKAEFYSMTAQLSDSEQAGTLRLRYYYGYKPAAIAEANGTCEKSVYRHIKQGKAELQRMFPDSFREK